jgi:uncharacterized protein
MVDSVISRIIQGLSGMSTEYHALEQSDLVQDWSDTSLLSKTNDWSKVASITGFRGATLVNASNVNAQTVTGTASDVYVAVNQTDPNVYQTAGVAEFQLANPTVAIAGSASSRAPYLALYLDATGRENVTLSFTARDLESGVDNAVQQIAVQYRIGDSGTWINLPAGYIADASVGGATKDTKVTVTLPDAASGHANLQVRILTTDFVGFDEWIGIDDIRVTSQRDPDYRPDPIGIFDIQGAAHVSPYEGKLVATSGVVTALEGPNGSGGFYLQAAVGDGNSATSDAVFVKLCPGVTVAVGDAIEVCGVVKEVVQGEGLPRTEIAAEDIDVLSHGNALPTALLIGADGVLPPTQVIEDDAMASFDPTTDGLDFWESLEGMRVTIDAPQAVSNTDKYGQTDVVASHGEGATGMNSRGGISLGAGDYNPEKIQIDDKLHVLGDYSIGDQLSSVTGVVNYSTNRYEVLATDAASVTRDVTLTGETADFAGDANHLTVATYNVGNLDPTDSTFGQVGHDIVFNLHTPDVIALQKVQDADGTGTGSNLSGMQTAQLLIDAIFAESGVRYTYVEIAPGAANTTAGQLDGNIRPGYLYRADRVSLADGSLKTIDAPIYDGTRKPLVATWTFNGQDVTTINVHFTSRVGSDALWGDEQNPYHAGTVMRTNQIAALKDYVANMLSADPATKLVIAGDWNGYAWENAQTQLTSTGLVSNLSLSIDAADRYSNISEGSAHLLDNIVVSNNLLDTTQFDIVHINSEFSGSGRASDHDPLVTRIYLGNAPIDLALSNATVAENAGADALVGTLAAADTLGDTLTYSLINNADGLFDVNPVTGALHATHSFDFEGGSGPYTVVAMATDSAGLSTTASFVVSVTNVNEAPVARADSVAVTEDATSGNLWATLLANDSDPDAGDGVTIGSINTTGTLGTVTFDAASKTLRYAADHDAFDALAPGQTFIDHFIYTARDNLGQTYSTVVDVVVTGQADGMTIYGGGSKDSLAGTAGEDFIYGGNGQDSLFGGAGHDWLQGDNAADTLTGGSGRDTFAVSKSGGLDTVTDFEVGVDRIALLDGMTFRYSRTGDYNNDGKTDLQLTFTTGSQMVLLGIDSLDGVAIDTLPGATSGPWYGDYAPRDFAHVDYLAHANLLMM